MTDKQIIYWILNMNIIVKHKTKKMNVKVLNRTIES